IDSKPGGQNRLHGSFTGGASGLQRMADDGSGNGLTFDSGFSADYWISLNSSQLQFAKLGDAGGIGSTFWGSFAINNINTAGVSSGCGPSSGSGVTTGIELEIPLAALDCPSGPISICAFISGTQHDYVSNQVAAPLPAGTCNLGEPRSVNFANLA